MLIIRISIIVNSHLRNDILLNNSDESPGTQEMASREGSKRHSCLSIGGGAEGIKLPFQKCNRIVFRQCYDTTEIA